MGYLVLWIVCAILGGMIGSSKGRGGAGFMLGLLLGPIGVIVAIFLKENDAKVEEKALADGMRKCPFCAELVKGEALVCKHCGKDLPAVEPKLEGEDEYETWICPKCQAKNLSRDGLCQSCGKQHYE